MANNAHAMYSMEMPNAKLVRQGLENLKREIPNIGRQTMYRFAQAVSAYYAYTANNPPKREAYVRTFAMREARHILKEKYGYVFVMDPIDPRGRTYAAYVVGNLLPDSQARLFKSIGWIPLRRVVETEMKKLDPEIRKQLGALITKEQAKANRA